MIIVSPISNDFTNPKLSTVALLLLEDTQATAVETSLGVPSEYVPVAINCTDVPSAALGDSIAVTSMETKEALVTDSSVMPETLPKVAVIVLAPVAVPIDSTFPSLLTVAMSVLEEDHVTDFVIFGLV